MTTGSRGKVRAWDLPTRAFHWALAALIAISWASQEYSALIGDHRLVWHRWSGYAVLILIVWRLLWGFGGSSTSRFANFLRGPGTTIGYAVDIARGRPRHFLGHNPIGALMVVALLSLVGGQASMGLFTVEHNDLTAGPLYRLVEEDTQKLVSRWHRRLFYWLLLPAVGLHVAANLLHGLLLKDPLIQAMMTGLKPAALYEDEREAELVSRPLARALGCLAVAAGIVLGGIVMLGGRL